MITIEEARELSNKKLTEKLEKELDKIIKDAANEGSDYAITPYFWTGGEESKLVKDILTKAGYKISKHTEYNPFDSTDFIKISWID